MTKHFAVRVSDGKNFRKSSKLGIWGIKSNTPTNKGFLRKVQSGDKLWFVKNASRGKILAVATYMSCKNRGEVGTLLDLSMTNEDLGWTGELNGIDIEIHYTNLYWLDHIETPLSIKLTNQSSFMEYKEENKDKLEIDLPAEYSNIVKYSGITRFSLRNSACAPREAGTEVVSLENLPIPTLVPRSGIDPQL